jgi:type II secretory ATPase GspE/PulE/Tfp pilus assembly ATPase PilB-like protein
LFPRGPGFYFGPVKLIPLLLLYFGWLRLCRWADQDARALGLPARTWNLVLLAGGLLGLLVLAIVPAEWFALALPLLVALSLGPILWYVHIRDRAAPAGERLLSEAGLRRLLRLAPARRTAPEGDRRVPVRFLDEETAPGGEGRSRAAKAEDSRGYRTVRRMVYQAVSRRASDVRLEPARAGVAVRMRVDGILHTLDPLRRGLGEAVISVLKVLAGLDVAEKRKPQDGAFSARVDDRLFDLRVATSGNLAGERLLLRVVDREREPAALADLGMADPVREQVRELVGRPQGLLLVAGPAGSGRSATVRACLQEIDRFQRHVLSLDVAHPCPVANVSPVRLRPGPGQTFAGELRGLLRQAVDVLALDDLEDRETAEAAGEAAATGHLVLASLPAADAVAALALLVEWGVPPATVGAAVSGVLCQRLVRVLCPECRVRYRPDPEILRKANLSAEGITHLYRAPTDTPGKGRSVACAHCGGSGYRGRTGVFELLIVTEHVRALLHDKPNFNAVRQEAIRSGMRSLQEDGLRQVIAGTTSIQELLRVTG